MSPKKTIELDDLKLTPKEMELLISGARVIFPEADPQEDETLSLTADRNIGP